MAQYKNKLKRQDKIFNIKLNTSIGTKLFINNLKKLVGLNTLFHDVIIDIIKDELKHGRKEIRFYYDDKNNKFESLKELYKQYTLDYNVEGRYNEQLFEAVYDQVYSKFFKYTRNNNKNNWDLIISKNSDYFGKYFYVDMIPRIETKS